MMKLKTNTEKGEKVDDLLNEQEVAFSQSIEFIYTRVDLRKVAYSVYSSYERNLKFVTWKDIYNESIIRLMISLQKGRFKGNSKLSYYFDKICRNYCNELIRKSKPVEEDSIENDWVVNTEQLIFNQEVESLLQQLLSQQSKNCKKIFEFLFYYPKAWEMSDIADELNLSNSRTAITTYHRCKKKLIQMIENNDKLRKLLKSYL